MQDLNEYCVILTTCGSKKEAENLARLLIERRLAACVQTTAISSFYEWKGNLNRDEEELLLIKTRYAQYGKVEQAIVDNHSYEVPEIIAIPIVGGLGEYLVWIDEVAGEMV